MSIERALQDVQAASFAHQSSRSIIDLPWRMYLGKAGLGDNRSVLQECPTPDLLGHGWAFAILQRMRPRGVENWSHTAQN